MVMVCLLFSRSRMQCDSVSGWQWCCYRGVGYYEVCSQWIAGNDEVEDSYYGVSYRRQPQSPIIPAQLSPWAWNTPRSARSTNEATTKVNYRPPLPLLTPAPAPCDTCDSINTTEIMAAEKISLYNLAGKTKTS